MVRSCGWTSPATTRTPGWSRRSRRTFPARSGSDAVNLGGGHLPHVDWWLGPARRRCDALLRPMQTDIYRGFVADGY